MVCAINASGRLTSAFKAVEFFKSSDYETAYNNYLALVEENEERKLIERRLTEQAKEYVYDTIADDAKSIVVVLEDGHPGVVGIVASRLKETFGLPSVVLCPTHTDNDVLTGSGRSIDHREFDIRTAIQYVMDNGDNVFKAAGGHKGAIGCKLHRDKLEDFIKLFEQASVEQLGHESQFVIAQHDGELHQNDIDFDFIEKIESMGPFGRGFEKPVFLLNAHVIERRVIGQTQTHLKLKLGDNDFGTMDAIWFNARETDLDDIPVERGEVIQCIGTPQINEWNGRKSVQFNIQHAKSL